MIDPFDKDHQKSFTALVARETSLIRMVDNAGFKPLHRAVQSCQSWAVQHIIENGADPKEADPEGNIVLHFLALKLVGEKTSAAAAQAQFKRFLIQGKRTQG